MAVVYRYGLDCPTPVKISLKITPGLASCEKKGENKRQFQANLHRLCSQAAHKGKWFASGTGSYLGMELESITNPERCQGVKFLNLPLPR
ncbi:hypothetical protein MGG_16200 [Pyricularia oryzae 70-15]|uniref:Uncharacterized protein n=1 Tax=Pyricularia oryzae (strain 70-15 / ATCC MYA-4617 / FGSC 8958) TaxID=242507 RepID=G4MMX2_PYRO7|nr:uncharacterized protein MGG_16200 [Pyricularia oryzae 70-15]EHA56994.1 hypothetical protein MGG_16200 [Pyricularia oryzae 70-15]